MPQLYYRNVRPRYLEGSRSRYARESRARQEKKFVDVVVDAATIATTGSIYGSGTFVGIADGTGDNARIGRKVSVTDFNLRYVVELPTTATAANATVVVRVMIYLDKQANKATAAVTDLLEQPGTQLIFAYNKLENSKRFRILYDKFHTLNLTGSNGTNFGAQRCFGAVHLKFKKPIVIEYATTAATVAAITSNNIGIAAWSQDSNATIALNTRARYTDA